MALFDKKKAEPAAEDHYEGDLVYGVRHGRGTMIFKSGNVYKGDWRDGNMHGLGEFTFNTTGDHYVGEMTNGKIGGYGRMKFHSGHIFEGYYVDGKRNGRGSLTCSDGRRFEGEWINDKLSGMGILWYNDGRVFRGMYVDGNAFDGFTSTKDKDGFWKQVRYVRPELENIGGYEVVLTSFPDDKKIAVIKEVREITGYGLALAKEITENAPQWLKKGLKLEEAVELKRRLETVGAEAEVK